MDIFQYQLRRNAVKVVGAEIAMIFAEKFQELKVEEVRGKKYLIQGT